MSLNFSSFFLGVFLVLWVLEFFLPGILMPWWAGTRQNRATGYSKYGNIAGRADWWIPPVFPVIGWPPGCRKRGKSLSPGLPRRLGPFRGIKKILDAVNMGNALPLASPGAWGHSVASKKIYPAQQTWEIHSPPAAPGTHPP